MNEALIFDAVRTPRGKGKRSGSLNEVTPVQLAAKVLKSIESRNNLNFGDNINNEYNNSNNLLCFFGVNNLLLTYFNDKLTESTDAYEYYL